MMPLASEMTPEVMPRNDAQIPFREKSVKSSSKVFIFGSNHVRTQQPIGEGLDERAARATASPLTASIPLPAVSRPSLPENGVMMEPATDPEQEMKRRLRERHREDWEICHSLIRQDLSKCGFEWAELLTLDDKFTTNPRALRNPMGYYRHLIRSEKRRVQEALLARARIPLNLSEPERCTVCDRSGLLTTGEFCVCVMGQDLARKARWARERAARNGCRLAVWARSIRGAVGHPAYRTAARAHPRAGRRSHLGHRCAGRRNGSRQAALAGGARQPCAGVHRGRPCRIAARAGARGAVARAIGVAARGQRQRRGAGGAVPRHVVCSGEAGPTCTSSILPPAPRASTCRSRRGSGCWRRYAAGSPGWHGRPMCWTSQGGTGRCRSDRTIWMRTKACAIWWACGTLRCGRSARPSVQSRRNRSHLRLTHR